MDGALAVGEPSALYRGCVCDALDTVEADSRGRSHDEEGVWEAVGGVSSAYQTLRSWIILRQGRHFRYCDIRKQSVFDDGVGE